MRAGQRRAPQAPVPRPGTGWVRFVWDADGNHLGSSVKIGKKES